MFTIKHIVREEGPRGAGRSTLYEARNPRVEYGEGDPALWFEMDDGSPCRIDSGVSFIMNAQGKTVDTVRLKGSDWF